MNVFSTLFFGLLFVAAAASAQEAGNPRLSDTPLCAALQNMAGYKVNGTMSTNYYLDEDGDKMRHWDSFSIDAGNQVEICSAGPFFEGERVELTLRTLFPVFSCYMKLGSGPVVIKGGPDEDGVNQTWADCL